MNKLEKLEQETLKLSNAERWKLLTWLDEYQNDAWDRHMEADSKSGKLDHLIENAREEIRLGKIMPMFDDDGKLNKP